MGFYCRTKEVFDIGMTQFIFMIFVFSFHMPLVVKLEMGPPLGFGGSGENGFLISGSWGALVIGFRDLGSKLIVLGIKGALQKI